MATLKEQMTKLIALQHRLTVWEVVFSYLDDTYISKDGRTPKVILAEGCLQEQIPEDVVEGVMEAISGGPIADLTEEIRTVENQEIDTGEPNGSREG